MLDFVGTYERMISVGKADTNCHVNLCRITKFRQNAGSFQNKVLKQVPK